MAGALSAGHRWSTFESWSYQILNRIYGVAVILSSVLVHSVPSLWLVTASPIVALVDMLIVWFDPICVQLEPFDE